MIIFKLKSLFNEVYKPIQKWEDCNVQNLSLIHI
ncbi:MAG: hypothetical protein CI948_943, partial [Halanaerobium sp.]